MSPLGVTTYQNETVGPERCQLGLKGNRSGPCPWLGPPARCPFSPFFGWEDSPTKIDTREQSWYPYSNLSTGGPSWACLLFRAGLPVLEGTPREV